MKPLFNCIPLVLFSFALLNAGGQDLKPTAEKALMRVKVMEVSKGPRGDQKVSFTAEKSERTYSKTTGNDGTFKILLPKGDRYEASYEVFGEQKKYKKIKVPDRKGKMSFKLNIKFRMPSKITLDDVHFNTGKATLRESSFDALNEVEKALKQDPGMKVEIAGHTDSQGSEASNQKLSQRRAQSVVDHLVEQGVDRSRLNAKGYGEKKPIAPNDTEEGRQKNRRTDVRVLER